MEKSILVYLPKCDLWQKWTCIVYLSILEVLILLVVISYETGQETMVLKPFSWNLERRWPRHIIVAYHNLQKALSFRYDSNLPTTIALCYLATVVTRSCYTYNRYDHYHISFSYFPPPIAFVVIKLCFLLIISCSLSTLRPTRKFSGMDVTHLFV